MTVPFAVGPYLVVPYRPFDGASSKNELILSACEAHPAWFTMPLTRGDIRVTVASVLTDPDNAAFEVWRAASLVGILLMDQIVPRSGIRWHFVFFDGDLVGKRDLLIEFLRRIFADLDLQRVSLEVPEHVTTLVSFARRKLGFRYEGESTVPDQLPKSVARVGSRRERAHFDGTQWRDVLLMRLLRSELV